MRWESTEWMEMTSERAKSSSLSTRSAPCSRARSGVEILAPGDRLHAHGGADPADLCAEIAEADEPKRLALEVKAERRLPAAAGAHRLELLAQMARQAKHQGDRDLGRRPARATRAADRDVVGLGGLQVDGGVALARGDQQLEVGELVEQRALEGRALAHDADHLEGGERAGGGFHIGQALVEDDDAVGLLELRPVGDAEGHVLIVVEDGNGDHGGLPS